MYYICCSYVCVFFCFFCDVPATTEIYTLSLHDALPIWHGRIVLLDHRLVRLDDLEDLRLARVDGPAGIDAVDHEPDVDRKSTRLNSSHITISYAVFCLKKKKKTNTTIISTQKIEHILRR